MRHISFLLREQSCRKLQRSILLMQKRPKECTDCSEKLWLYFLWFCPRCCSHQVLLFLLTQKVNQFLGLRMVMRNVFVWNVIRGKLALRYARGLGQVGIVYLSLRALGLLWGTLWILESTKGVLWRCSGYLKNWQLRHLQKSYDKKRPTFRQESGGHLETRWWRSSMGLRKLVVGWCSSSSSITHWHIWIAVVTLLALWGHYSFVMVPRQSIW